ncbi:MAG: acyl-CoA thioesterase [Proteobacteria bacterium]|nr:acyl-CoA thioesterase [Pseudomonadota bacterium]
MINHKLVLPEHLNHYGYLFGGYLLHWVDEYAYITANLDFRGHRFVTIGLENVVFRQSIKLGSVLKFDINRIKQGRTSVSYNVKVYSDSIELGTEELVFDTNITFVNIDEQGTKCAIEASVAKSE